MADRVKPLTSEEKSALRERTKRELERLEAVYADEATRERVAKFKEKFGICEIVYKVVFSDYEFNRTGKQVRYLKINMSQAPSALLYAGYDFDRDLLTKLFGGEERVGRRSVKKLRDALTHAVKQSAVNELLIREEELYGYMDQFLTKVREFDNEEP